MITLLMQLFAAVIFVLFLFFVKSEGARYALLGAALVGGMAFGILMEKSAHDKEYLVELIDQHKVEVTNLESGKVYTTTPEKIHEALDRDNL